MRGKSKKGTKTHEIIRGIKRRNRITDREIRLLRRRFIAGYKVNLDIPLDLQQFLVHKSSIENRKRALEKSKDDEIFDKWVLNTAESCNFIGFADVGINEPKIMPLFRLNNGFKYCLSGLEFYF